MVDLISRSAVDGDDQIAVVTTYQGSLSLRILANGFLEIATIALKNGGSIDATTPAVIHAIRHAVELFLKHVISELQENHHMAPKDLNKHNMLEMFNESKDEIAIALECEDIHSGFDRRAWLSDFEQIITKLHEVDPYGSALRYPTNLKGQPNLGGTMQVSLNQLTKFAAHTYECFAKFNMRDA